MRPGLYWRTACHLTPEQIAFRLVRRARHRAMSRTPEATHERLARLADGLPSPDPSRPALACAARPVLQLQQAAWPQPADALAADLEAGRFRLLNHDVAFGSPEAIDWRGDFAEGSNPLRRMTLAYFGYAVPLLASGAADATALAARLVRSFDVANPPGVPGTFRDVWNPYAASHRLINLLAGLALWRERTGAPDADAEAVLLGHARRCAALIQADPERDVQYNHLLKNYVALAVYAAGLEAPPDAFRRLRHGVPRSLHQNILADGGPAERSPMYHLLAVLDLRILAATNLFPDDWDPTLAATLDKAEMALAALTHPDGNIALFGDSWLGDTPRAAGIAAGRTVLSRASLPQCGYVRLAGGDDAVLFDCGPLGPDSNPAHGHADFLSVEISIGGRRLIVDPGVATYTAGSDRDATRAAAHHNGPRLVGVEPVELWGSFRAGRRSHANEIAPTALEGVAPLSCAGEQTGYRRDGVVVRRYVGMWPGRGILIADAWAGRSHAPAESGFLVAGDWQAEADSEGVAFTLGGRRVTARALVGGLAGPEPDRYFRRYGVAEPAHRLNLRPDTGPAGARRAALWLGRDGAPAPVDQARISAILGTLIR